MNDRERVRELFDRAVELGREERAQFLTDACADDRALRTKVEELLACDATVSDPIAASLAAAAHEHLDSAAPWLGQRVGNYRIVAEIGHGGMGSVFLAERDDREYESRVAIKLIRGFPTRGALERLRRERQVLAGLDHPGIARLLDGGTTEGGQPYLVMEYIDGVALDKWFASAQPRLRMRLELFRELCLAVHYAHQHMVVHSDLKPNNVLVRSDGRPVLLDFGIARLLDREAVDTRVTELRAFTPDYASPEQLAGGRVTSASDIFGLGLILYELLCARPLRRPIVGGWRTARPSRIAAQSEQAWVRADAMRLRGDLEHVVTHALAEDPAQRYSSAAAMAADIDRYFSGQPLEAGPDRLGYQLRKFVRRHVFAVAVALSLIALALGFGIWLGAERNRALRAESEARIEAATADRVTEFLLGLFKQADPENTRGRDASARELLDQGRERLQNELSEEPVVKGRLLAALGAIYTSIGQPEQSTLLLEQAVGLLRTSKSSPQQLSAALNEQCHAYGSYREYTKALAACRQALAIRSASLAPDDPDLARSYDELGIVEQGMEDFAGAERDHHRALDILSRRKGNDEEIASVHHNLGFLAHNRNDFPTAQKEYTEALQTKRAIFGEAHPLTLNSLQGLAQTENDLGETASAKRDFETLLTLRIHVHGENSISVARAHNELASLLQDLGDYAGAEQHYRETQRLFLALLPPNSLDDAVTDNNLATLAEDRGDYPHALELFRSSLALRQTKLPAGSLSVARAQHNLARCLLESEQRAAAKPLLDSARLTRAAQLPITSRDRFDDDMLAAEWTLANGDARSAESALRALTSPAQPAQFRRRARLSLALAQALARQHRYAEAATFAQQAYDELLRTLGALHPSTAAAAVALAQNLKALGDEAAARNVLDQALPVLRRSLVAGAPVLRQAEKLEGTMHSTPTAAREPDRLVTGSQPR